MTQTLQTPSQTSNPPRHIPPLLGKRRIKVPEDVWRVIVELLCCPVRQLPTIPLHPTPRPFNNLSRAVRIANAVRLRLRSVNFFFHHLVTQVDEARTTITVDSNASDVIWLKHQLLYPFQQSSRTLLFNLVDSNITEHKALLLRWHWRSFTRLRFFHFAPSSFTDRRVCYALIEQGLQSLIENNADTLQAVGWRCSGPRVWTSFLKLPNLQELSFVVGGEHGATRHDNTSDFENKCFVRSLSLTLPHHVTSNLGSRFFSTVLLYSFQYLRVLAITSEQCYAGLFTFISQLPVLEELYLDITELGLQDDPIDDVHIPRSVSTLCIEGRFIKRLLRTPNKNITRVRLLGIRPFDVFMKFDIAEKLGSIHESLTTLQETALLPNLQTVHLHNVTPKFVHSLARNDEFQSQMRKVVEAGKRSDVLLRFHDGEMIPYESSV